METRKLKGQLHPSRSATRVPLKLPLLVSKNKYQKAAPLAQIWCSRSTGWCHAVQKKGISWQFAKENNPTEDGSTTPVLSPDVISPENDCEIQLAKLPETPETPQDYEFHSDSLLESLPLDLLVKVMCHLHHDELQPVFHVSWRIHCAVSMARQKHFNYTTPDRTRQEMLKRKALASKGLSPPCPNAPLMGCSRILF